MEANVWGNKERMYVTLGPVQLISSKALKGKRSSEYPASHFGSVTEMICSLD